MINSLLTDEQLASKVYTVMGIIFAVIIAVVLIIVLIRKVIIPKIEDKKAAAMLQEKRQKEQSLNKIWLANYKQINAALKTVLYPGLVDSWKNFQDMLHYKVKDNCPYCNGKLVEEKGDYQNTTSMQYSPTGQIVNSPQGYAHLWVGKEAPDGGYRYTKKTVCEKCRRPMFEDSDSSVAGIDSKKDEMIWRNSKTRTFLGVNWRNSSTEKALGKELCDYIDLYGFLRYKVVDSDYSTERRYR